MFKKLVVTGAVAGLLLVSAAGAFARSNSVTNNATNVTNNVLTVANTGVNQVNGGGSIGTGVAGAQTGAFNVVNTSVAGF